MTKESHIYLHLFFSTPLYHVLQVSPASFKTNLLPTSKQKQIHVAQSQISPTNVQDLVTLSSEQLDFSIVAPFDLNETQPEATLIKQGSLPQEEHGKMSLPKSENYSLPTPSSVTPESIQTSHYSPDDQIINCSHSTPEQPRPESGSPQFGQLESDLEDKLKFRPEALDPLQNPEFSDESSEDDDISKYEDTDTVKINMAEDTNHTNVAVTEPAYFQTSHKDELEIITSDLQTSMPSSLSCCENNSHVYPTESLKDTESPQRVCIDIELSPNSSFPSDIFHSSNNDINATQQFPPVSFLEVDGKTEMPEEYPAKVHEEESSADTLQSKELDTPVSSHYSSGVTGETILKCAQDQLLHFNEASLAEVTQTEDVSSQSVSDITPETVTSTRHFSFEQLMPNPSPGNLKSSLVEERPKSSGHDSEDFLTADPESCASSIKPKPGRTSSTSDEEYSIPPGYAETCSTTTTSYCPVPSEYTEVVNNGVESPVFEYSDPEPYFDCKQAASDFSETELDECDPRVRSGVNQPYDHLSGSMVQEKVNQRALSSSGSENYEEVHQPLFNAQKAKEELLHYSETSDEEFTLCEASQPPALCEAYDKYLTRVRSVLVNHNNLQAFPKAELNHFASGKNDC